MEILYRPYSYKDISNALGKPFSFENEIVEEKTVHIMMYFDFKDIQGCIKEGIITPDLYVCHDFAWEQIIEEDIGYKVELITKRLVDLDDKDHDLRGQAVITPFCINFLNCSPNRQAAKELSEDPTWIQGRQLKKMEFRIVVPYRLGELKKKFQHEEITLADYKSKSFELQYPVITNIEGSKYSKNFMDTTVEQMMFKAKVNKRNNLKDTVIDDFDDGFDDYINNL